MRSIIYGLITVLMLSSCTLGSPQSSLPDTAPDAGIPPDAKVQSGYEYPAIPLDQYRQSHTGV